MGLRDLPCRSGVLAYMLLSTIVFLAAMGPGSVLPEVAGGFLLGLALLAAFLASWIMVAAFLGASLAAGALLAGLARLLGYRLGLLEAAGYTSALAIAALLTRHFWVNGRVLSSIAEGERGPRRLLLRASSVSYRILAAGAAAVLVMILLAPLYPGGGGEEHVVGEGAVDAVAALVLALIAVGKLGLAYTGFEEGGRLGRAFGALQLAGSLAASALAYYLLGPLLHLPLAPGDPIVVEEAFSYRLPAAAIPIFTLTGLLAWLLAHAECS